MKDARAPLGRTEIGLPVLPMIGEAELLREARPYAGQIRIGQVFAWEPDLSHARELLVVTRIGPPPPPTAVHHSRGVAIISNGSDDVVYTRHFPDGKTEVWNDLSRFREAVVPTRYKDVAP
jgi:hypothetical protein